LATERLLFWRRTGKSRPFYPHPLARKKKTRRASSQKRGGASPEKKRGLPSKGEGKGSHLGGPVIIEERKKLLYGRGGGQRQRPPRRRLKLFMDRGITASYAKGGRDRIFQKKKGGITQPRGISFFAKRGGLALRSSMVASLNPLGVGSPTKEKKAVFHTRLEREPEKTCGPRGGLLKKNAFSVQEGGGP